MHETCMRCRIVHFPSNDLFLLAFGVHETFHVCNAYKTYAWSDGCKIEQRELMIFIPGVFITNS